MGNPRSGYVKYNWWEILQIPTFVLETVQERAIFTMEHLTGSHR